MKRPEFWVEKKGDPCDGEPNIPMRRAESVAAFLAHDFRCGKKASTVPSPFGASH